MSFQDTVNGMIIGILLIKLIEYKLKRSKKYQELMKHNKLGKILKILREKKDGNKSN